MHEPQISYYFIRFPLIDLVRPTGRALELSRRRRGAIHGTNLYKLTRDVNGQRIKKKKEIKEKREKNGKYGRKAA